MIKTRFARRDDGSAAVEYSIALGLVALALVVIMTDLTETLHGFYAFIRDQLTRISSL